MLRHEEISSMNLLVAVPAETRLIRFAEHPRRVAAQLASFILHLTDRFSTEQKPIKVT